MMLCEAFANPDDKAHAIPDTKFTPNLVNTCMFVLANQMQVNNFWANYRGAPFMEDLKNNVYFWYLLQGVYAALLIVVGGQFEPLNDLLQLVSLPNRDFQIYFLGILVGNAVVTYGIERLCRRLE
jgi:cation-transporting ATPase 13A1